MGKTQLPPPGLPPIANKFATEWMQAGKTRSPMDYMAALLTGSLQQLEERVRALERSRQHTLSSLESLSNFVDTIDCDGFDRVHLKDLARYVEQLRESTRDGS